MHVMQFASNIRNYKVYFDENADFLAQFEQIKQRCYVVDSNVWELYKDRELSVISRENLIVLPISEERKTLDTVQELYQRLIERAAKRNLTIISIGGGILQDVSGFAASTLYRGVNWIFVPTTLLAQADSCVGSKTSLNYKDFKNLIGTFYPPSEVHIYAPFLATQAEVDFYSGLGEVVKLHILGGSARMQEITELLPAIRQKDAAALLTAVQNSLSIKQDYISGDEFDTGRRNLLNFGHDFGHALEATSDFAIPHGQAVVLGMLLANQVARQRELMSANFESWVAQKLLRPALVVQPKPEYLARNGIIEAMKKDKKRTGDGLALIMLHEGQEAVKVDNMTLDEAVAALNELQELLA